MNDIKTLAFKHILKNNGCLQDKVQQLHIGYDLLLCYNKFIFEILIFWVNLVTVGKCQQKALSLGPCQCLAKELSDASPSSNVFPIKL